MISRRRHTLGSGGVYADALVGLQTLVVEALLTADALGLDEEGISLDAARLAIASRMRAAGLEREIVDVPAPDYVFRSH